MPLYPLLLDPIYKEKVWGGRSLERLGRVLPGDPNTRIGESWELVDLATTSPDGGGGEAAHSRIVNGPLARRTLDDLLATFGSLISGSLAGNAAHGFPILLKYLDAQENLSVQVHPPPAYVAAHPEARLKSEAWYVVSADPGAMIYTGVRPGTTPAQFRDAIHAGTVADLLRAVPAIPGECHYLPSGTCHALGAGVMVAEVQTASDTTFRVYDWGRTGRELHIEQALKCIDFEEGRAPRASSGALDAGDPPARLSTLVTCDHFVVREVRLREGADVDRTSDDVSMLMLIEGTADLLWGDEATHSLPVRSGNTVLVPAALERLSVRARTDLIALEITPPQEA